MPQGKTIKQDGKTYTFFPGRNGRLTAKKDQEDKLPEIGQSAPRSKVIRGNTDVLSEAVSKKRSPASPTIDQLMLRKKRQGVANTLAATRG